MKNVTEFHKLRSSNDGLQHLCKDCKREANRETEARNNGVKIPYKSDLVRLKATEKRCSKCKEIKLRTEFGKDKRAKSGLYCYCKSCTNKLSIKYNPYKRVGKTKAEIEQGKHYFNMASMKQDFGLTEIQFQSMMNDQKGCCEICGKDFSELSHRAPIDHNHNNGSIRGLLCTRCNTLLGHIELNEGLLQNIINYLNKYSEVLP